MESFIFEKKSVCGKWILIYKEDPTLLNFAYHTENDTGLNIFISSSFMKLKLRSMKAIKSIFV